VRRMRPPRFIPHDAALQPYVLHEAEGVQLLHVGFLFRHVIFCRLEFFFRQFSLL